MNKIEKSVILISAVWLWLAVMFTLIQYGGVVLWSANTYTVGVAGWLLKLIFR